MNRMKWNDVTKFLSHWCHWWHSFRVLIECNFCIIVCCIFMNENAFRVPNFYGLKSHSLRCVGVFFDSNNFQMCAILCCTSFIGIGYWPLMNTAHFQRKTYTMHVLNVIHWCYLFGVFVIDSFRWQFWLFLIWLHWYSPFIHSPTIRSLVWSAFIHWFDSYRIFFFLFAFFYFFFSRLFQISFSSLFFLSRKQVQKLQALEFASSKLLKKKTITIETIEQLQANKIKCRCFCWYRLQFPHKQSITSAN